jgi:aminoglycoside phosphotransferase (APT) family kinase protein
MPIPEMRDLTVARKVVRDWLAEQLPDASGVEISELTAPGGTGFSNETLLFDATWTEGGDPHERGLVVRVKPTGYQLFLEADFDQQYRLLKLLDDTTDVPVPPMYWFESDESVLGAPFFVMGKVDGKAPTDNPPYNAEGWLAEATPEQRETLWLSAMEGLSRVHNPAITGVDFLAKPQRGATGFDQQLRYWEESFTWAAQGRPQPVAEAAWEWMQAHLPSERPTSLSWGDARIGNMLFGDDFTCRAIVDWEMLSLGGPMYDLGWWLFLDRFHTEGSDLTRLPGLGSYDDTISQYESLTGTKVRDLEFYEIYAGFRFAIVMMKLSQMFTAYDIEGMESMETNNPVTQVLARMLGVPPPA